MIFVECYADITLVKYIINLPGKEIAHEFKGKGGVCGRLRERPHRLGLVDEDPSSPQPLYITESRIVEDLQEANLRVLHHSSGNNYLIVLCPRLEEWILGAAREISVDVLKYSLPDSAKSLHNVINFDLRKFEKLLDELKNSSRIKNLKSTLSKYYSKD